MRTLGLDETNAQEKSHKEITRMENNIGWNTLLLLNPKMKPILFNILCFVLCQNLSC